MNTSGIYIQTEPETKKKAEKTAKELGFDLSEVIDRLLKQFIRTKRLDIEEFDEEPSEELKKAISQAEKHLKEGKASPTFKTGEEAVAYLEKQGI